MNALKNKQLMQNIFSELSKGNDEPFVNAMAEDMKWVWMGSGQWAKTFDGKKSVLDELWSAVRETLVPPYKVNANHFIAEEDYVVVEATGQNRTPDGKIYENKYCWICRIENGKLHELREYMDTDLVTKTFGEANTQHAKSLNTTANNALPKGRAGHWNIYSGNMATVVQGWTFSIEPQSLTSTLCSQFSIWSGPDQHRFPALRQCKTLAVIVLKLTTELKRTEVNDKHKRNGKQKN